MANIVVTPATLKAALKAAKPGDTLALTGDFGHVVINPLTFATPLNIDARAATFVNVQIKGCTGILWTGGSFVASDWAGGMYLSGCKNVTTQGMAISGLPSTNGVTMRESSNVHVLASALSDLKGGVSVLNCDGWSVADCTFDAMSADSIDAVTSTNGSVLRNRSQGNIRTPTHPDFGQFRDCDDMTIRGNTIYGPTQGINNFGSKLGRNNRFVVEDNVLLLTMPQAIAFDGLKASFVRNNSVFTLPGSDNQAAIRITNSDAKTIVCGNRTAAYSRWKASIDPVCAP